MKSFLSSPLAKLIKRLLLLGLAAFILIGIFSFGANEWVKKSTASVLYSRLEGIPANDVGLVLGAGKHTSRGNINLYFKYRLEAAAKLYHAGKIKHILVSGDNHKKAYDEATDMLDYLVSLGVPEEHITRDYAGFRTLDSVVRAKKVFGQDRITIISQPFHNERAIFIAQKNNMEVVAFNAQEVPGRYSRKTMMREYFAKCKAVMDLYLLQTQPKFLGEPLHIAV